VEMNYQREERNIAIKNVRTRTGSMSVMIINLNQHWMIVFARNAGSTTKRETAESGVTAKSVKKI